MTQNKQLLGKKTTIKVTGKIQSAFGFVGIFIYYSALSVADLLTSQANFQSFLGEMILKLVLYVLSLTNWVNRCEQARG